MRAIVIGTLLLLGSAPALADKAPTCGPGEVLVRDNSQKDERGRGISRCVPQKKDKPPSKDDVAKPRTPAEERLVAPGPRPIPSTTPSSAPTTPPPVAAPPPPPPTATPEPAKPEPPKQDPRSTSQPSATSSCAAQPGERAAGGLASLLGLLLFAWLARRGSR